MNVRLLSTVDLDLMIGLLFIFLYLLIGLSNNVNVFHGTCFGINEKCVDFIFKKNYIWLVNGK